MNFVKNSYENITLIQNRNIEFDPYFNERKKDLKTNANL
jgi:hypothetical protein